VSLLLRVPMVGVNDEYVTVVAWKKSPGDLVHRGEVLCIVETTKATVDIEATSAGYLVCLAEEGKSAKVGDPLAALTDQPNEDIAPLLPAPESPAANMEERRWTKKAALLARRSGVDLEKLADQVGGRIVTEQDVLAAQKGPHPTEGLRGDLVDEEFPQRKASECSSWAAEEAPCWRLTSWPESPHSARGRARWQSENAREIDHGSPRAGSHKPGGGTLESGNLRWHDHYLRPGPEGTS